MARKTVGKSSTYKKITSKLQNKTAITGVVGLGYVGLPLSMELARAGFTVTGFDISNAKVKLLNSGRSDIDDVPDSIIKEIKMLVMESVNLE